MCFQMLPKLSVAGDLSYSIAGKLFRPRGPASGTCAWNSECSVGRWAEMTTTTLRDELTARFRRAGQRQLIYFLFWLRIEEPYSPKIHGRYRQDTSYRYVQKTKRTIICNINYNCSGYRFLTTALRLCCALHTKFLRLLSIVSATSDWPVYL